MRILDTDFNPWEQSATAGMSTVGPGGMSPVEHGERGMDAAALSAQLEKHLQVGTFPVGIPALRPGEPHLILPGSGDRIFGMAGDDENGEIPAPVPGIEL